MKKDILRSYMRSHYPWIDAPTDMAIKAVMYKIASKIGVRNIFCKEVISDLKGHNPVNGLILMPDKLKYVHTVHGTSS